MKVCLSQARKDVGKPNNPRPTAAAQREGRCWWRGGLSGCARRALRPPASASGPPEPMRAASTLRSACAHDAVAPLRAALPSAYRRTSPQTCARVSPLEAAGSATLAAAM
eukprot:CAMPEP_0171283096 /NCGR_PEP_ID=MMETSP0790-20130122/67261_1 /TAXON_ID=2925 /ORGANISM="Alexandrium catenella, Strain OF101" /LENGTH=109 /DNA_ID=CAMNT_0011752379 /DNA_START=71 /DNA_END=397 /DNA_ORIENTATION=+